MTEKMPAPWQAGRVADTRTAAAPGPAPQSAEELEVDRLVGRWLPLPDAAEVLGLPFPKMRRLVDDRAVVALRRGTPRVLSVPEALVVPSLLESLAGTLSVLRDSGYGDVEALRWLFTPDDSLGGTPVEQLRLGHKTEIRRRAQALAL